MAKEFLTSKQAAEYLGLSLPQIYRLSHMRRLPYTKPGGKICYFRVADLDAFMSQNRIATAEEIGSKAQSIARR